MNKNILLKGVLIIIIILLIVGIILGIVFYKNGPRKIAKRKQETHNLTLQDMYCNVKESKRIVKVKVTIETKDKDILKRLDEKQFLIRDDINKIIRNKVEGDLQGKEGQIKLQQEIKESLKELFNEENISNVYFNDLIIQ